MMNIKAILIGSLALGVAVGGTLLINSPNKKATYIPNADSSLRSSKGHAEYMHMLRQDPATGIVDQALVSRARKQVKASNKKQNKAALGLTWEQQGPDNVGGRTRAILIDRNNSNIVYAGSVTGGLFVSTDAALTWRPVSGMQGIAGENLAVSCITQTANGRVFFGTGSTFESSLGAGNGSSSAIGNGVYEYVPSTGEVRPVITNTTAVPNNNASSFWSATNAIASYGNRLYLGTRDGMVWADPDGSGAYPTSFAGWTNPIYSIGTILEDGIVQDIDVASDGSMLVCFGGTAYFSNQTDAVGSFTKHSFSGSRLSGAIAPSDPNVMYVLGSSGTMAGLSITTNKGGSWSMIVPPGVSTGTPASKDPFVQNDGTGGQGGYDDAIAVNPGNPGHVIVGGVQLYGWYSNVGSDPTVGTWEKIATLFESATNPTYVHADKHTIVWQDANTVYVGSDGGVAKSFNAGQTWLAANYGFNVTTFYDMDIAANGYIAGGAQDNGTQVVTFGDFGTLTPLGSIEVQTGDGFDVHFSNLGTGIIFATSQYGSLTRAAPGGAGNSFYNNKLKGIIASNPGGVGAAGQPFHTVTGYWENKNATYSLDSVTIYFNDSVQGTIIRPATFDATGNVVLVPADTVFPGETIQAGDTIHYVSLTNGLPLQYVVPADIVLGTPTDSITLVDPIQSRFATRITSSQPDERGVYLTQDATRLNVSDEDVEWFRIAPYSNIENIVFSNNGNNVFLGSHNGKIYRVSGLNLVTSNDDQATWDEKLSIREIATGLGGVVSMAIDPKNSNNMIATSTGYTNGNHVYRFTNALNVQNNVGHFTAIQGAGSNALPHMPVYDVEIAYSDKNKVIIGTEWGVWATDNAFSASNGNAVKWTDESGSGMAHVPVFAVEQQQLNAWQAVNSGVLYLGTHGRGFYKSTDFSAINVDVVENEAEFDESDGFATNLSVYPNPMNSLGTLSFQLNENVQTTINIYNLTGTLVKTIPLGMTTKGEHQEQFNVTDLSVGTYVIALETGNKRKVSKFIVTR